MLTFVQCRITRTCRSLIVVGTANPGLNLAHPHPDLTPIIQNIDGDRPLCRNKIA